MTKSELIDVLASKLSHRSLKDVDFSVKNILDQMAESLAQGERIEDRGFGSFTLHYYNLLKLKYI
jgi:integration host factor subunit beta